MNSNETGQKLQTAREMTAEIERETNSALVAQNVTSNSMSGTMQNMAPNIAQHNLQNPEQIRGLERSQAGNFGSKVLTYNPELNNNFNHEQNNPGQFGPNLGQLSSEQFNYGSENHNRALRRAEVELAQDIADVTNSEELIGVETKTQVDERLEEDREDIANEQGLNGEYVKNLMDRNNKRITKETVSAVDNLISKHEYHPGQLDLLVDKARSDFLKDVFNRIRGARN